MRRRCTILRLAFRNIGKPYFFPPAAALLVAPLIVLAYRRNMVDPQTGFLLVSRSFQLLLPVLLIWWIYFALKEQIEGSGREVLWVYRTGVLDLLLDLFLIWLWYALHMAFAVFVISFWFASVWRLYLHLLIQSLVYMGFFCLIAGLSGSAAAGFLTVLVYYFAASFFATDFLAHIGTNLTYELLDGLQFLRRDSLLGSIGLAGTVLGVLAMRRKKI